MHEYFKYILANGIGKPKYKYNHKAASANYLRQLNTGLFIGISNKMSSIINSTPYICIVALKIIAAPGIITNPIGRLYKAFT